MQDPNPNLMDLANFGLEENFQGVQALNKTNQTQIRYARNVKRLVVIRNTKTREMLPSLSSEVTSAVWNYVQFDPVNQGRLTFLTYDAAHFLQKEKRLQNALMFTIESITSFMKEKYILHGKYVDIARDIESPNWEALKIQISIFSKNFDEMLKIWSQVCRDIYSKLDKETAKKIYIIMKTA